MQRGRLLDVGLALAATSALVLAAIMSPGTAGPACPFRALTGLLCPTCGMTRSFVALFEGDVAGAFAAHPAGPILVLSFAALAVAVVVAGLRRARPILARRGPVLALEAVVLFTVVAGLVDHI